MRSGVKGSLDDHRILPEGLYGEIRNLRRELRQSISIKTSGALQDKIYHGVSRFLSKQGIDPALCLT